MVSTSRGAQAHFDTALSDGRLEIQRCNGCMVHVFYPREVCPNCGNNSLDWVVSVGLGTVYSTTTVRLNPERAHEVSLIDLDEGVRLMSRVENITPGSVRIGQRVRARVAQENGASLLVFDALKDTL